MANRRLARPVRRCRVRRAALLVAGLMAIAGHGPALRQTPAKAESGSPRPRHLADVRWGIGIDTPPGWSVAQQTGYSETVFLLLFPDGSRISLSAERTAARSADEVLEPNRRALAKQGFPGIARASGPGAWLTLDFEVPASGHGSKGSAAGETGDRDEAGQKVRQLYLVRRGQGPATGTSVVLTLTSPASAFAAHVPDLTFVVDRITFEAPTPPAPASPIAK